MSLDADQLRRVSRLFDELLECSEVERARRVADLHQSEPELAAELSNWLDQDRQSQGVLDGLSRIAIDTLNPEVEAPGDRSGQRIGAYELQRRVGRGGMGEVYEARRPGADFEQRVAIKLLRRGLDSEDIVQRFLRERRILAQLEHPGIARLIDGGLSAEGMPYLVMEYVEGSSLIDAANRQSLDLEARLNLFLLICEAVAYAHRRLIVHRDLKPSNVLLSTDNQPKLLDFGIAKLLDGGEAEPLTDTGMRILTPGYAAPEQILGLPISTATDVYALGVILYELLTGQSPHQRSGKPIERIARELGDESASRPSIAILAVAETEANTQLQKQRIARQLRGDLDMIVLHALKREPERRYQGAAELADDIRRYLAGHPVRAEADTLGYRFRKFVRRHRGGVTAAALATLGVLAGLVVALWQADRARASAAVAEAQSARAEAAAISALDAAARTRRVKDFMMQSFIHADPIRSAAGAPQTVDQAVDDALARIDNEIAEDPKLQVDLLDDFGEIRTSQGRFDEAQALFERAFALAEQVYGKDHPVVAESLLNRASIEMYHERPLAAEPLVDRAVAILEAHVEEDPLPLVNALGFVQAVREAQGRRDDALAAITRALAIQRQHGKPNDPQLGISLSNLATALFNMQRFDEAEPIYRESIRERERLFGPDNPGLEMALSGLADIEHRKGEYAAAAALNARRLQVARKTYPGTHPWTASVLTDLGWESIEAGESEQGFAYLDEAIAMYKELGSSSALFPYRYRAIGKRKLRDDVGALADFDLALAECQSHSLDHPACALVRGNRAGILARLGRNDEALREADAAMADLTRFKMQGSKDMAQAMESKALALSALGQQAAAESLQSEALAIYVAVFGPSHIETERVRRNLQSLQAQKPAPR